jgi:hypothetical protein
MPASARAAEPWSPYGLEAYRVALLRRRSRLITACLVLGLLALGAVLLLSIKDSSQIQIHGGNGDSITVQVPEQPRAKPLTLSVSPGRTTVLERPIQPEQKPKNAPPPSQGPTVKGLDWSALLTSLAPPVLLAIGAAKYAKKRIAGPLEQVNLGVYKGAMPLELITAQHKKHVFTGKRAYQSLFGKGREEHVPPAKPLPAGPARTTLVLLKR